MSARPDARTLDDAHRHGFLGVWRLEPEGESAEAVVGALPPVEREKVYQIARRRLAMQLLYEIDAQAQSSETPSPNPESLIQRALERVEGIGPIDSQRVAETTLGAWRARGRADADFALLAPEWPAHRMAGVDRAILRLGHHEITRTATPAPIVISECVELARAFSTDRSPAFINALLDGIARRHAQNGQGTGA